MSHVVSEDYKGPERRREIILGQCDCHTKHSRILDDHDKRIDKMERQHGLDVHELSQAIGAKLPSKLFYWLIGIFIVTVVGGLGVVYSGIHNVDKSVAVMQKSVEINSVKATAIERSVERLGEKVERVQNHMNDSRNGFNHNSSRNQ